MSRRPLFCDCGCGQVMAIDHGAKVVVKAKHHGHDHYLTISKVELIDSQVFEDEGALLERVGSSTN